MKKHNYSDFENYILMADKCNINQSYSSSNEKLMCNYLKLNLNESCYMSLNYLDTNIKENFDVVYSWGVLHHTGNMWKAIDNASELVSEDGLFYISIYFTSYFSKTF